MKYVMYTVPKALISCDDTKSVYDFGIQHDFQLKSLCVYGAIKLSTLLLLLIASELIGL